MTEEITALPLSLSAKKYHLNNFRLSRFLSKTGTDHNVKSEGDEKRNGNSEEENGTSTEDRKRKHEDTQVNGDHNGEELKKEIDGTTDVNGNEGPEAKKKKLEYTENSHKNEMVGKTR